MSNSLVSKSLALLGYEDLKREKKRDKKRKRAGYKGALELIPAKHRVISVHENINNDNGLGRSSKLTVYEAQKRIKARQDPTEENVENLLLLSTYRINPETANQLVDRALKKRYVPKIEKKKKEESTVFTEADFKKFEEEYTED